MQGGGLAAGGAAQAREGAHLAGESRAAWHPSAALCAHTARCARCLARRCGRRCDAQPLTLGARTRAVCFLEHPSVRAGGLVQHWALGRVHAHVRVVARAVAAVYRERGCDWCVPVVLGARSVRQPLPLAPPATHAICLPAAPPPRSQTAPAAVRCRPARSTMRACWARAPSRCPTSAPWCTTAASTAGCGPFCTPSTAGGRGCGARASTCTARSCTREGGWGRRPPVRRAIARMQERRQL